MITIILLILFLIFMMMLVMVLSLKLLSKDFTDQEKKEMWSNFINNLLK